MDVLTPLLDGTERSIAVTLHAVEETRARLTVETVEVRLDGRRAGVLTAAQAAHLLPLVKHVSDRRVPVARATLKGNELKADIALRVAKTQDIEPLWSKALAASP